MFICVSFSKLDAFIQRYILISLRRFICGFRAYSQIGNIETDLKMAEEDFYKQIKMTAVVDKVRELQNLAPTDEDRRTLKNDLLREMNKRILLRSIGDNFEFEDFHKTLKKTLGINEDEEFLTKKPMYTFPQDLMQILHNDVTPDTVEKLFENQYKITWHTKTGDPDQFSFYRFCKSRDRFRTYNIRRAHVMTRLWRARNKLDDIRDLNFRKLFVPLFISAVQARLGSG